MCLVIKNDGNATKAPEKTFRVFKWYEKNQTQREIKLGPDEYLSPFRFAKSKLRKGAVIVSDRKFKRLTEKEIREKEVHHGFHGFASREDAEIYANKWEGPNYLVEFSVRPRDFVARGMFDGYICESVVFKRGQVVSITKI